MQRAAFLLFSCQKRMFFSIRTWTFFHPISAPKTPSQKQGGERTDELLIAGEQTAEAPLRLPSVQTTCSGLRDCTVVCTLVRLCWDTPHTASAARGQQRDTLGEGGLQGEPQGSLIPQPGGTEPFGAMLDVHLHLHVHQPAHNPLILPPSLSSPFLFLSASPTCPRGSCVQGGLCFTC